MSGATIFDNRAVRLHRDRAAARLDNVAPVLDELAAKLLDRLDDTRMRFTTALDFGGRGSVATRLQARGMTVISADISPALAGRAGGMPVAADPEFLPFGEKAFDLIVACMSLHWVNDLPGALIQLRRALRPDGLFLASMPVLGTLAALRTALLEAEHAQTGAVNPRVSPFPELRDCAGLLSRAGFTLPVADAEDLEFMYASPFALFKDLRDAGESNAVLARGKTTPPRALFAAAAAALPARDGKTVETLRVAVMTGWGS